MVKERVKVKIYRSLKALHVQAVDSDGKVILGRIYKFQKGRKPVEQAEEFGQEFGKNLSSKVKEIAFDRGRFLYHGQIESFAEGMRKAGIIF